MRLTVTNDHGVGGTKLQMCEMKVNKRAQPPRTVSLLPASSSLRFTGLTTQRLGLLVFFRTGQVIVGGGPCLPKRRGVLKACLYAPNPCSPRTQAKVIPYVSSE